MLDDTFIQPGTESQPATTADPASPTVSLTYAELLAGVARLAPSPARAQALTTTLSNWLTFIDRSAASVAGPEFFDMFEDSLPSFRRYLLSEAALSDGTAHKRAQQIRQLQRAAEALKASDNLPARLGDALQTLLRRSAQRVPTVARLVGMSKATLYLWLRGAQPRLDSTVHLQALERYFELPVGALQTRAEFMLPADASRGPRTAFALRRSEQTKDRALEGALWLPFEYLAPEWSAYVLHKTDETRPEVLDAANPAHPPVWRSKSPEAVGVRIQPQMQLPNGRVVPSAGVAYGHIATYLGWRRRVSQMPITEAAHLAWLADVQSVKQHAAWKAERSGGRWHSGIADFLAQVATMARPKSGYLWQNDVLVRGVVDPARLLGVDPRELDGEALVEAWRATCERCYAEVLRLRKAKFPPGQPVRQSRNPQEAMAELIHARDPLNELLAQLQRYLETTRLLPMTRRRLTAERDCLTLFMLAANPLRISQFALMTWRADNTGNLYQTSAGSWRLRFTADDFKNTRGAAHSDYDAPLPESLNAHVQFYLDIVRPQLDRAGDVDYVFLPTVGSSRGTQSKLKGGMWDTSAMSDSLERTARRALRGIKGFGPHSMRHLVATSHFRSHPGDIEGAARLLNDRFETVRKTYYDKLNEPIFERVCESYDRAMRGRRSGG